MISLSDLVTIPPVGCLSFGQRKVNPPGGFVHQNHDTPTGHRLSAEPEISCPSNRNALAAYTEISTAAGTQTHFIKFGDGPFTPIEHGEPD
jgi:hypothetical protein